MNKRSIFMDSLLSVSLLVISLFRYSFASTQNHLCHYDNECSALLQFKGDFKINISASYDPAAYPKTESWKYQEGRCGCCDWDGVECDVKTGYVISLDLSSSCLYGSINSSSSLFRLAHLQRLNLADNNFARSQIPIELRNLSSLKYLNLSLSVFYGQVPAEILELSRLVSLDLSGNHLRLQKHSFRNLLQKLNILEELHLSQVNVSGPVPQTLANLTSLTSLFLTECELLGEFPREVFLLPKLQYLNIASNPDLTGCIPDFPSRSRLEELKLYETGFSGVIPGSIDSLKFLKVFIIDGCEFSGSIPSSLGNLTELNSLSLISNNFTGDIPSSLGKLTDLTFLRLAENKLNPGKLFWLANLKKLSTLVLDNINLRGDFPSSIKNLTQLTILSLSHNQLATEIPSWIGNLTQLTLLDLQGNKLYGPAPESISRLVALEYLTLSDNHLTGQVNFNSLKSLTWLDLGGNNISISINITGPQLQVVQLPSCNLRKFPTFLQNQSALEVLVLSDNKIHGKVPEWMLNISKESLSYLDLGSNFLTGFESKKFPTVLPWTNLLVLELPFNLLQGSPPIPQPSISVYDVYNNRLTGEIPKIFCNLTSVFALDLSFNSLNGKLPECLGDMKNSPLVLNFENNEFYGEIPQIFLEGCNLRIIDFSQNRLSGKVPKSLVNCTMLEYLNLRGNLIDDTFPYWLGSLSMLKVLILGSNGFRGKIEGPEAIGKEFPMLQIVDLSGNGFSGELPEIYLREWNAMKTYGAEQLKYLQVTTSFPIAGYLWPYVFSLSMVIDNKGTETYFEKIQEFLVAIDLSKNLFEGGIPDVIGRLRALRLLNLSHNILTGQIPLSLGNLSELESLDLSHNKLSGEIPEQLADLTFLGTLDVSYNRLTGQVPHGQQFDTFPSSSFEGNPGLCGQTLSKQCEDHSKTSSLEEESDGSDSVFFEFGWRAVAMGFGSGVVIGLTTGYFFVEKKNGWFAKKFAIGPVRRNRARS